MGNILGHKEQKNTDRGNIKICEKRYGYNLNDLHSYIYKINLPLKPAYIEYILEDKRKNVNTPEENRKENRQNNEKEKGSEKNHEGVEANGKDKENQKHGKSGEKLASDNYIDLYKNYEKDNIGNTNNIYKNKLIINKESDIEKIEDKYIHFFYNSTYKYDTNKNNIYTAETASDYIANSNKINEKIVTHGQKGNREQELKSNEQNEKHGIHKTYANMCLNYYNILNTCVIKKYEKNVQNRKYKFTRLHTCKPHYVLFSRCIRYRDKKLMHHIKKMEWNYFKKLNEESKSAYLNEFLTNLSYHEYLISKLYDGVEKIKLTKELQELRERYNHIVKENEITDDMKKPEIKGQRNHKPILLNIQ